MSPNGPQDQNGTGKIWGTIVGIGTVWVLQKRILFNRVITRTHGGTITNLLYDLGYFVEEKGSLLLSGSTMIQVVSPENNFGFTDLDLYVKSGKMNLIFCML